jgi:trehalose 6-phosphate synthase/phosphatase
MQLVECAITGPPSSIPVDYGYQSYLTEYIEDSTKLNLLLDYDGTLAPIVSHPDLALMSTETRRVLTHLSQMPSVSVCVMSGRSLDNLRKMVAIDGITYAGSQGLEILHPDGIG